MQCDYFDAGRCRSCSLMGVPYNSQLADKQTHCEQVLADVVPVSAWGEPHPSRESGFRNKAKLVVAGQARAVTLGILDGKNRGIDLRNCGLYEPAVHAALEPLGEFINELGLIPYDVPARRGELKYLIVTGAPNGELMVRFVMRSRAQVDRLRRTLPILLQAVPGCVVASVNLQPEHKAILEGEVEIPLTEQQVLPMLVNDIELLLRPNSFFQTNTPVAAALYRQAQDWLVSDLPESLWDLYCGVGGFALHTARAGVPKVTGVEVAPEAVVSAELSAESLGLPVEFLVGDATQVPDLQHPELVLVNPPRRGIGPDLAAWLETSGVQRVIYSSCNPVSLAKDLAATASFQVTDARLFDMFPQTSHQEVMVNLRRG